MARVVDDRGDRAVVLAVEADDRQGAVGDAVRVQADGGPAVGRRHPPVHRERRATRGRADPDGPQRRRGVRGGPPDRLEHRFDVGRDELAVPADPGPAELERHRNGVVVRRADGDVRSPPSPRPPPRALAPAQPGHRRECRGRRRRSRHACRRPLDDEHGAQSSRSLPSDISCSWLPQPPAGIPTGGVMSALPTPARMWLTATERRSSAGLRTPWAGRRRRAVCRLACDRAGARPPSGPSRSCRAGRPRRPAGRGR